MKSIIIGHRGAAGLALENTIESIRAAKKAGVDMIELDVRITADNYLVLNHDDSTVRTFGVDLSVRQSSLHELQAECPQLPTLEQALKACGKTPVMLELKTEVEPEILLAVIDKFPELDIRIASFKISLLSRLKKAHPNLCVYVLEHHNPFDTITRAKGMKADGVGLNFSLVNPLTYWLIRRHKLEVYAYTVNHRWNVWFLKTFYPRVAICTDYPDQFIR